MGLCCFATSNWEAHEKSKKAAMIQYTSRIDSLFRQVQALRPTNMACPPNIWAGLFELWEARCTARRSNFPEAEAVEEAALDDVAGLFGGRIAGLATGGAPTPKRHLDFATELAHRIGASFVDSYGTTECGAVAANGRSLGPKFADVRVVLVDHVELGFTSADKPEARGEVVVSSPSLALGYLGGSTEDARAFLVVGEGAPSPASVQPPLQPGRWYFTGDLAARDATGRLTLIDRVSAAASTRHGRVVRCGELEGIFEEFQVVRHCLAHASPEHETVAVILCLRLAEEGPPGSFITPSLMAGSSAHGAILGNAELCARVRAKCHEWGVEVRFGVAECSWTVENRLLSGELKKRRGELLRLYSDTLRSLHGSDGEKL